eukprot:2534262-Pyramimonas_sp.AAC.1
MVVVVVVTGNAVVEAPVSVLPCLLCGRSTSISRSDRNGGSRSSGFAMEVRCSPLASLRGHQAIGRIAAGCTNCTLKSPVLQSCLLLPA